MNLVFANQNKEDAIYPLTTREIAEAQDQDNNLKTQAEKLLLHTAGQKHQSTLLQGQNGYTKKPTTPCSSMVSSLLATSRDQASRRNSSSFDVLERSTNDSPITCQTVAR